MNNFIKSRVAKPLIVFSVEADRYGSLRIRFSKEISLELFPDDTLEEEYWRFFELGSGASHLVVTGQGIGETGDQVINQTNDLP